MSNRFPVRLVAREMPIPDPKTASPAAMDEVEDRQVAQQLAEGDGASGPDTSGDAPLNQGVAPKAPAGRGAAEGGEPGEDPNPKRADFDHPSQEG